jgi:transcriptional regulator of arginine metabolism
VAGELQEQLCDRVSAHVRRRDDEDGVIGSIAGDDTVLVIAAADVGGETIARLFLELAGHEATADQPPESGEPGPQT